MKLENKAVVVTGASSGMGKAIVELFVKEGASVVAVARRKERLEELAESLKEEAGKVEIFPGDISLEETNEAMIDLAVSRFGRLDVLVNNDSPNADKGLVNESLNREIERALSTLATREREIVKSFFGIGCQEMTLEEIGERFGLTRERVRQIKEKAIRKLRSNSRSKLLKSYLG